ncbi:hypothetical protein H4R35_005841 [Dimargaris xerosporica]|nr:hypothetical protein H4R35_005841 [Dimargaris xerosporica]
MKTVFGLMFVTLAVVEHGVYGMTATTQPTDVTGTASNVGNFDYGYSPNCSWADDIPKNNSDSDRDDNEAYKHSDEASNSLSSPRNDHDNDQHTELLSGDSFGSQSGDTITDTFSSEAPAGSYPCSPEAETYDGNNASDMDEEFFDAKSSIQTPSRPRSPAGNHHGPMPLASSPRLSGHQSAKSGARTSQGYAYLPNNPNRFVNIPANAILAWRKRNLERLCRRVNGARLRFINYIKMALPGAEHVENSAKDVYWQLNQLHGTRAAFEYIKSGYSQLEPQLEQFGQTAQELRIVLTHTNPQLFASVFQATLPRNPSPVPANQDQLLFAKPVDTPRAHKASRNFLSRWQTLVISYVRVATITREFAFHYQPTNIGGTTQDLLEQDLIQQLSRLQILGEKVAPYFGLVYDAQDLLRLLAKFLSSPSPARMQSMPPSDDESVEIII